MTISARPRWRLTPPEPSLRSWHWAWGELRFSSGSLPSDVKYTGQREQAEIGLYYYQARWYDPALGRFAQADTVVPEAGNSQALDRYAYVYNNPLRYSDPTGHYFCQSSDECSENTYHRYESRELATEVLEKYSISYSSEWATDDLLGMAVGAMKVGYSMASTIPEVFDDSATAFTQVFGPIFVELLPGERGRWTCLARSGGFSCPAGARGGLNGWLFAHEMGHVINHRSGGLAYNLMHGASIVDLDCNWVTGLDNGSWKRGFAGYVSDTFPYLQHGPNPDDPDSYSVGEEFADMFLNFSYDSFAADLAGFARYEWMLGEMPLIVDVTLNR